jgi:hypothetical protein
MFDRLMAMRWCSTHSACLPHRLRTQQTLCFLALGFSGSRAAGREERSIDQTATERPGTVALCLNKTKLVHYKKENSDLEDIDELVIDHCIIQVLHAIFFKKDGLKNFEISKYI